MKIAATLYNFCEMMHVGGPANIVTYILEIPDEQIPASLKSALEGKDAYTTVGLSLLKEK